MSILTPAALTTGYVFNIQRYSLHDGPGIRTIVFLKGCPLHCRWCSNPESQQPLPELAYNPGKCIGTDACFLCKSACPHGAIGEGAGGRVAIDRDACQKCFGCANVCPSKAMHIFGRLMSVAEVLDTVETDGMFYSRSGGGLTLSGGEPLMQADFAEALVKESRRRRIDATIETTGFAVWADLERVAAYLKTILYDIKSMDAEKHKQFTGVDNELILHNFVRLREAFPQLKIIARTPVVPGFNDTEADIGAIVDFLRDMPNVEYELLPYHRLGQQKYEYLGRPYPMADILLNMEKAKALQEFVKASRC